MKTIGFIIALLVALLPTLTLAGGFKQLTASEQFEATHNVPDTTTNAPYVEADSVNVTVVYHDGTPATTLDSVWYNSGDAQATSINDQLHFFDAWDDMNGAEGVGIYTVTLRWLNGTGSTFDYQETYTVYQTTMSLEQQSDSLQATLDSAQAIMARLINTQDSIQAILDTVNAQALWGAQEATVAAIALTGTNITTIVESRTLTDGTETNTFAATQVHDGIYYQVAEGGIGTNLNINYYLEFDIGPNTKAASIVYHGRLDEGSAPSGGDTIHVWVYDWIGTSWTHINAPGGDFIGINGSDSGDDETFEAQLVDMNYVGTGANVGLVRIAFSNYDPDGAASSNLEETTELYLDYVFLEYQSLLTASAIWAHDSAQIVFNSLFATLAEFDTLKYLGAVWVDDGSNTNTVVGTDGIPTNPVGTIAAAKTIADLIGVKKIVFIEGTNEAIGETMQHYEFIGIGAVHDITIDLGNQDLDGSKFQRVYLTGTQAGASYICADQCVIDGVDSLEILALNCAFVGPLSVRGGDSYFDNCYSTVAGAGGTPDLDFDGDAAVINVSMRHYSGGLQVLGMTSNHTMSYEADGQLIINADCVSANIVARGNMTPSDNGTTTNLNVDAVFSRAETVALLATLTNQTIMQDTLEDKDVLTSVGTVTGNVDGSVGSVTGNVGGNVVGSVASVTAGVVLAIDGLDGDSSFTNLQNEVFQIYIWVTDSSFVQFGFSGRTITPWAKPNVSGSGDRDTLFYGAVPSDTLGGVEYFHVGGAAWDDADSMKTFIWP